MSTTIHWIFEDEMIFFSFKYWLAKTSQNHFSCLFGLNFVSLCYLWYCFWWKCTEIFNNSLLNNTSIHFSIKYFTEESLNLHIYCVISTNKPFIFFSVKKVRMKMKFYVKKTQFKKSFEEFLKSSLRTWRMSLLTQ